MLYHIKLLYNKSEKDNYFSKRFMIGCAKNTQQIGYNSKPLDLHQVCNRSIQVFGCSYIMQPNQACFPQPTASLTKKYFSPDYERNNGSNSKDGGSIGHQVLCSKLL